MANPARRMLIVDDEQLVCQSLKEHFARQGFLAFTAFSGEDAIKLLSTQGPFDIVLLDIMLPGIHGLQVLKRAKELHPRSRVVMMTALEHEELVESARAGGADAFVHKPFSVSDSAWTKAIA